MGIGPDAIMEKVNGINYTMLKIYDFADKEKITTAAASDKIAELRINSVGKVKDIMLTMNRDALPWKRDFQEWRK